MRGLWSSLYRIAVSLLIGLALAGLPGIGQAQDEGAVTPEISVLLVDQERLFAESAFGKASIERERAALTALEAENNRIQTDLIAEEQELTLLRKTLSVEDFSARAEAFDQKVEAIRAEQDAKARDLTQAREKDVKEFFEAAAPVLSGILAERKAGVILDKKLVMMSLAAVDVTDEAIRRIDAVLGETEEAAP